MSLIRFLAITVSSIAVSSSAFAQAAPLTKADIPALVKEALMNEPEIVMQALEKLRAQKAEQARKTSSEALAKSKNDIYANPNIPAYGASVKDADVTIVEFFDYHCGYCKRFLPELVKIVAEDKKLRVLFVDLPILSEDSKTAARAAIAVHRIQKDKYFDFHSVLMTENGKFDEPRLLEIAKKVGVNADKLKAEMAKPEVAAIIDSHHQLAGKLGISGTPALILGNDVVPGAMSSDEIKKYVQAIRAEAKTAPAAK